MTRWTQQRHSSASEASKAGTVWVGQNHASEPEQREPPGHLRAGAASGKFRDAPDNQRQPLSRLHFQATTLRMRRQTQHHIA